MMREFRDEEKRRENGQTSDSHTTVSDSAIQNGGADSPASSRDGSANSKVNCTFSVSPIHAPARHGLYIFNLA